MKVIIAGGGTGGHLYPGIAVAERLSKAGVEVLFLVSDRGIEKRVLEKLGYKFVEQDLSGFAGVSFPKKLKALAKFFKGIFKALKLIDKKDKVLMLGGFVSAPVAVATRIRRVKLYVHEQNSVMGLVNRMFAPNAEEVFLSYKKTLKAPKKSLFTGNPIREELCHGEVKELNEKKLLVVGGSSGSRIINKTMAGAVEKLLDKGYKVRHQTGDKLYEETKEAYGAYANNNCISIEPYITDMAEAYKESDIIIARSGSGSVFEISYAKRPAVYIPFAGATDNHQYYNALTAEEIGVALIMEEKDLSSEKLVHEIEKINEEIDVYKSNLRKIEPIDSAGLMIAAMKISE